MDERRRWLATPRQRLVAIAVTVVVGVGALLTFGALAHRERARRTEDVEAQVRERWAAIDVGRVRDDYLRAAYGDHPPASLAGVPPIDGAVVQSADVGQQALAIVLRVEGGLSAPSCLLVSVEPPVDPGDPDRLTISSTRC